MDLKRPDSLDYSATIPRTLVHKASVSEVLLTDARALDGGRYTFAAQLPGAHSYYNDTVGGSMTVDPLAIVEACRQAVTVFSHVQLGVGQETAFLLRSWTYDFTGLDRSAPRNGPVRLRIVASAEETNPAGRLRTAHLSAKVAIGGSEADSFTEIGHMSFHVSYVTRETYRALRHLDSERPPLLSSDARTEPTTVSPFDVGRSNSSNVVITEPILTASEASALLRLPFENASMFDHAQDHVPGLVVMEAARQLGYLHDSRNAPVTMLRASADFTMYSELDSPTVISGSPTTGPESLEFVVTHRGSVAARLTADFSRTVPSADRPERVLLAESAQ